MEEMRFDGKVAIVTGAGGGLGKSYAQLLATRGAKVLVNDLGGDFSGRGADAAYAAVAAEEIRATGGEAEANVESVATSAGADAIVADAIARWGRVDILVNNAGVTSSTGDLDTLTDEQWNTDMGVAAGGTFYMCRAVWRGMIERGYGRIVNISSSSFFGMGGSAVPYPAAKGAAWAMTRTLASNGAQYGIKVNCVMPSAAARMSKMMGEAIYQALERGFPARAVAPVIGLLAHEDVPVTGEMFTAGAGGFARVFAGVCKGYRAHDHDWTIEEARSNFDRAMDMTDFIVPRNTFEENALMGVEIPWDKFGAK